MRSPSASHKWEALGFPKTRREQIYESSQTESILHTIRNSKKGAIPSLVYSTRRRLLGRQQFPPEADQPLADKRALSSAILNLAEGNGRVYPKERARFFNISTASIAECLSCLDILASYNCIPESLHLNLNSSFKMAYAMIRKLAQSTAHLQSGL